MRTLLLCLFMALVVGTAHAQPLYVLVDRSSSISRAEGNTAKTFVEERLRGVADDALVSLTYFGGTNGGSCKTPVKIEAAAAKSALKIEQPPTSDSTPIFAALEAALPLAAANSGEIFLVTDGREGCGVNLCAAVKELRSTYPKVPITFRTVGEEQRDREAQDELGCLAAITSADVFTQTIEVPTVEPPKPPPPANFFERWYWLGVFLLFATAAIILSFHFGHCSVLLEQLIQGHKAPKVSSAANAGSEPQAGQSPAATTAPTPADTSADKPDSIEQDLRDHEQKRIWKRWDFISFGVGTFFLVLLVFGWGEFFENAQAASWYVLNSEFANAFAVLELSVIGFAGLEFWRYTQLKREHAVVSGELQRQANAEAMRRREVLFEAYGRQLKSTKRVTFSTPWEWRIGAADRENLAVVLKGLLGLATNPESTAENVTDARISDLRRYSPTFGGWDVQKFATQLLEDGRIPEPVFRDIEAFFDTLLRFRQPDNARAILARLATHFRPTPSTTEQGEPPAAQPEAGQGTQW